VVTQLLGERKSATVPHLQQPVFKRDFLKVESLHVLEIAL
jgi:hypothetical protein